MTHQMGTLHYVASLSRASIDSYLAAFLFHKERQYGLKPY